VALVGFLLVGGVGTFLLLRASEPVAGGRGDRPNIVLILTDDQRWDTLSVMPNVRRLLGESGVTFENASVTTALCCPSRASILTGQYTRHTGVYKNDPPNGGAPAFDDRSTVGTWLQDAGYTTALIGKYLNNYDLLEPGYVPPGWDDWRGIFDDPEITYYNFTLNENGDLVEYGDDPDDYSTTVLAERATEFILDADLPFFLYLAPVAPHLPARVAPEDAGLLADVPPHRPPSFNEADVADKPWRGDFPSMTPEQIAATDSQRVRMLRSLLAVDRAVATVVSALEARGALDDTVIVFTSDNGYFWGEHRLSGKVWPYDEAIRVPMVIRGPGVADPGRTEPGLALNIDLAPTFSDLAGMTPGSPTDGTSLVPLLRGDAGEWRDGFLVEFLGSRPPPFEGIRTERHLYVEYRNGWRELYDLVEDPFQLDNRADDPGHTEARAELEASLRALLD
jgi:arylsulfatase A-like enzyme